MIDHFSKYGWIKIAKNKTANTILRTLKKLFKYHGCPEILQSDNEKVIYYYQLFTKQIKKIYS